MKHTLYTGIFGILLGTAACTPSTSIEPPDQTTPDQDQIQAAANALLPRLRAHHHADTLAKGHITAIPHGHKGLLWQATHGNPLLVRARALESLRHFPDETSRQLLLQTFAQQRAPNSLRAGALRGMQGHLNHQQIQDVIKNAARSPDARLHTVALKLMALVPSLHPELEIMMEDPNIPQAHQDKAKQHLQNTSKRFQTTP